MDDDPEACAYVVPDESDPIATIYDIDPAANAYLIVRAVNEYDALCEVARVLEAARPFLGMEVVNSIGAQAGKALRALEEARRG